MTFDDGIGAGVEDPSPARALLEEALVLFFDLRPKNIPRPTPIKIRIKRTILNIVRFRSFGFAWASDDAMMTGDSREDESTN